MSPAHSTTAAEWDLPDIGSVSVSLVDRPHLSVIDATWPSLRPSTDLTNEWVWSDIVAQNHESLVVVKSSGEPVAIWSSRARRLLRIAATTYYRLDYLEIDPRHRGGTLGYFTMGMIASRALELGAEAMILQTFATHVGVYTQYGGVQRPVKGWNHDPKLVPFLFERSTLEEMRDDADVFLKV